MLTSEDYIRITKEATLGEEPSDKSEAALKYRKQVDAEVAAIRAKGLGVEIPFEMPLLNDKAWEQAT